jgi:hypothetical protein
VAATLAYLPFRVVYLPTTWLGRVVAWLAQGYRTAPPLERALIFPTWALLRGLFIAGWAVSGVLHTAARHSLGQ